MKKVTAGRDQLSEFASDFAEFNDDILFGKVWAKDDVINQKTRSILTITVLITSGIFDSSFEHHMQNAKNNGVSKKEIADIITHIAFYVGWPKAWAAFRVAKKIWEE